MLLLRRMGCLLSPEGKLINLFGGSGGACTAGCCAVHLKSDPGGERQECDAAVEEAFRDQRIRDRIQYEEEFCFEEDGDGLGCKDEA